MQTGRPCVARLMLCVASIIMFSSVVCADDKSAGDKVKAPLTPVFKGEWWEINQTPDLGELNTPKQQPVDYGVWQATDGTWQLWSCIRGTKEVGKNRLLHRWEGKDLSDTKWKPMGIAMRADEKYGEAPGALQAPFVFKKDGEYLMFYGDWNHICCATSKDGKTFTRRLNSQGKSAMFHLEPEMETHSRDPMVIKIGELYHCYFSANPKRVGGVYCSTSKDTLTWSVPKLVALGGVAGKGRLDAECPYVVEPKPGHYFLFRTQHYPENEAKNEHPTSHVYYSTNPFDFGIDNDREHLVCKLPVAAMEITKVGEQYYMVALKPKLNGMRITKLDWEEPKEKK
jgi:hypothetical protein